MNTVIATSIPFLLKKSIDRCSAFNRLFYNLRDNTKRLNSDFLGIGKFNTYAGFVLFKMKF